ITDELKERYSAEAKFIRALSYAHLYDWFGSVPLRLSLEDSLELPRTTDEKIKSFIESELKSVIPDLPKPGDEVNYGRPNKGGAMALLCKFYLNNKQWQKSVDWADSVINLQHYTLYPNYIDLFKAPNVRNKEFILVGLQIHNGDWHWYIYGAFAP